MIDPLQAPTPTRVGLRARRLVPLAALVIAGASLAAGCSSDDTTDAKASSTEITAQPGETDATIGDLKVSEARIGAPAGPTAGLYLSVTNEGDAADRLVGITTEASPEVQLHETVTDGNRTSMQELPSGVDLPAGMTTSLEPGGLHAMLLKVDPLKADQQVPVTLSFEKAGDVDLDVTVVPLTELGDAAGHGDMGHGDMGQEDTDHGDMDHG